MTFADKCREIYRKISIPVRLKAVTKRQDWWWSDRLNHSSWRHVLVQVAVILQTWMSADIKPENAVVCRHKAVNRHLPMASLNTENLLYWGWRGCAAWLRVMPHINLTMRLKSYSEICSRHNFQPVLVCRTCQRVTPFISADSTVNAISIDEYLYEYIVNDRVNRSRMTRLLSIYVLMINWWVIMPG